MRPTELLEPGIRNARSLESHHGLQDRRREDVRPPVAPFPGSPNIRALNAIFRDRRGLPAASSSVRAWLMGASPAAPIGCLESLRPYGVGNDGILHPVEHGGGKHRIAGFLRLLHSWFHFQHFGKFQKRAINHLPLIWQSVIVGYSAVARPLAPFSEIRLVRHRILDIDIQGSI